MLTAAVIAAVAASTPQATVAAVPAVLAPGTVRLTAPQMFRVAEVASEKGDLATATAIYAALEDDPDSDVRAEARFRHAKQLMKLDRKSDAAVLLRRVLDDKPAATGVRLELAQLLQVLGDSEGALRQLRAAQAAGLPPAVARMVDRFSEALRAARPFGATFEIAVAPDSNINHATRSDTLGTVFGDFDIDQDSKAKSGTGLALRGQAFRRFAIGDGKQMLLARASGFVDLYRHTNFNDIAFDLAVGPEIQFGRNRINIEAGATQRWFGQKPFMRSARIGATWARPLGSRMQVRLGGSASLIDNQFNDLQDGAGFSGRIDLERALTPTMGVGLNFSIDRQSLRDPGYSTTAWRAGVLGWRDLGRMTLSVQAEAGRLRADERLNLFPDKRSDRYSRLSVAAVLRQLTFGGFAPVARFTVERNRSTTEFYDFERTRSEMGLERAF